jgi:hypothetical protein
VLVFIDATGKVTMVKILHESPYPEFNEAAKKAALAQAVGAGHPQRRAHGLDQEVLLPLPNHGRMTMRKNVFLLSALALLGCGNNNFNTPQLLKTPRVLAIQAEPPQPSFGTSTTLRALIYLPPVAQRRRHLRRRRFRGAVPMVVVPGAHQQQRWLQVPPPAGRVDALAQQLGLDQVPQLDPATNEIDLGTGETATLTNPFPAQILDGICTGAISLSPKPDAGTNSATPDGGRVAMFNCDQDQSGQPRFGYPVTITLRYTPPCGSPPQDNFGPTLTTVFTVLLPRDDSTPGNQNPIVGGIQATWGGAPDGGAAAVDTQTDEGSPAEIDAGAEFDAGESTRRIRSTRGLPSTSQKPRRPWMPPSYPRTTIAPKYGVLLDDAFSTTLPRQVRSSCTPRFRQRPRRTCRRLKPTPSTPPTTRI